MLSKPGLGKGILDRGAGLQRFTVGRYQPDGVLRDVLEHFWTVRWDLEGAPPYAQHTLPDPAVHLVIEPGRSELVGVMHGRFTRVLEGRGQVFAAKFRPGMFAAVYDRGPVSALTDKRPPVADVLPLDVPALERGLAEGRPDPDFAQALQAALAPLVPGALPEDALRARDLVAHVHAQPDVRTVEDLAAFAGATARTVQRLFDRCVGVGPKWVIQRARLQEAAERLAEGPVDLAALAHDLGFADQAHLTRAFKDIVGAPPGAYAARNQKAVPPDDGGR